MKNTKVRVPRLLILLILFANFASRASAANKGFVIAMGGGNGTPEVYEKWRTLSGGTNAHVVLIPPANNPGDEIAPILEGLRQVFGIQDVSVLDPKDRSQKAAHRRASSRRRGDSRRRVGLGICSGTIAEPAEVLMAQATMEALGHPGRS